MSEVSVERRFWNRVKRNDPESCWPWLGNINPSGYGAVQIDGKNFLAHRLSFTLNKGAIPDGHVIDHLCAVKSCVNPCHLEAVSPKLNTVRYQNSRKPGGSKK